jgi:hypothetical protein
MRVRRAAIAENAASDSKGIGIPPKIVISALEQEGPVLEHGTRASGMTPKYCNV